MPIPPQRSEYIAWIEAITREICLAYLEPSIYFKPVPIAADLDFGLTWHELALIGSVKRSIEAGHYLNFRDAPSAILVETSITRSDRLLAARSTVCRHIRVKPDVYDQTVGVYCLDCNETLGVCWSEEHVSETDWNRACLNDSECRQCEQNRANVCAICGETFGSLIVSTVYEIVTIPARFEPAPLIEAVIDLSEDTAGHV